MSETSAKDAVYTLMIQCVLEYEIVLSLMAYTVTLIMRRRRGGTLQSLEIDKDIYIPGVRRLDKNMSPLIGDSSGITSPDSTESSNMSSAKTINFLDFTEMSSKSNS
jgi:hypothetical protein